MFQFKLPRTGTVHENIIGAPKIWKNDPLFELVNSLIVISEFLHHRTGLESYIKYLHKIKKLQRISIWFLYLLIKDLDPKLHKLSEII